MNMAFVQLCIAISETFDNADVKYTELGENTNRHLLSIPNDFDEDELLGYTYFNKQDTGVDEGLYISSIGNNTVLASYFNGYLALMYPFISDDNWVDRFTVLEGVKDAKISIE